MRKLILFFILLLPSCLLFADGRGVIIDINNYLQQDLFIEVENSQCVSRLGNIPDDKLANKQSIYLEATNGIFDGCILKAAWIDFNLIEKGNSKKNILAKYHLNISAINGTHIASDIQTSKMILTSQVYGSNKLTDDQDRITLSLSPKLDQWMSEHQNNLSDKNLNQIYLPGSHDSGSYLISSTSKFATDINSTLKSFGDIAKPIIANWSKTQLDNFYTQLSHGIRYFDLRICGEPNDIYLCHMMRGEDLEQLTFQVKQFLLQKNHSKEIILLDINHWYSESAENYHALQKSTLDYLYKHLGPWIAERSKFSPNSKLIDFWQQKKQVIILSTENPDESLYPFVWHSVNTSYVQDCNNSKTDLCSLWPDQLEITGLLDKVMRNIQDFNITKYPYLRLLQIQATPNTNTIVQAIINSTENPTDLMSFTKDYKPVMTEFINNNTDSTDGLLYIEDFTNGIDLTQLVVKKNT